MDSNSALSEVLNRNWLIHGEDIEVLEEEIHGADAEKNKESNGTAVEVHNSMSVTDDQIREETKVFKKTIKLENNVPRMNPTPDPSDPNLMFSSTYLASSSKQMTALQHALCFPGYAHGIPVSPNYHQPFVSMVRQKKTSALASALQKPAQAPTITPTPVLYTLGFSNGDVDSYFSQELKHNFVKNEATQQYFNVDAAMVDSDLHDNASDKKKALATSVPPECGQSTSSAYTRRQQNRRFDLSGDAGEIEDSYSDDNEIEDQRRNHRYETLPTDGETETFIDGIRRHETKQKLVENGDIGDVGEEEKNQDEEIVVVDRGEDNGAAPIAPTNDKDDLGSSSTSPADTKRGKSHLERLLMQPPKKLTYQEYQQPYVVSFTAIGNQPVSSGQSPQLSKTMQFYQPAQQHLARSTPPPGYPQPYGMSMRPHEEETRQIMNLDSQQTHNSSPTSAWNQPYGQMTNLNAYQQRGPNIYAPPVPPSMVHQNGPPGVVPTSNPYYPTAGPPPPPHHHIQPPAPMMAPGMHAQQQQQPYYNTQSPLTGTPPTMNYGNPQIPAQPPTTNGSAPIFNFSKPRGSNEGASVNGGGHRRKKHNDLSSPRYNSNEDVDASVFPDMADFPLLDVVQSKAKKEAGRKPCRPHLCEQSRMLISRVCHFHREFVKRLPSRHPLVNSPFSKPDQWTSQIMGISLATVRKCIDSAVDEEVFTRCTDKNLVNLTPSERAEREETLARLSNVFEGEKSLGAGTAGMTIAEYSPRRTYSNTLMRQSTDDKSSNSSFVNGAEYGSSETTLLNLDDHSNQSKDFGTTPTPTMELSNGGHVFEELGSMGGGNVESEGIQTVETPKRGRPRKAPGTSTTKSSKRKESQEDSEISDEKEDHEKKTEDEDETNEETEKQLEDLQHDVLAEREDDAASSEGTNRSETATPEPEADTSVAKKTRSAARRKNTKTIDEEFPASAKKKRGARSRQP